MKQALRLGKLMEAARPWGAAMRDLLFPPQCDHCRRPMGPYVAGGRMCRRCYDRLTPVVAPYCRLCAEPFAGELHPDFLCANCVDRKLAFDFAFAPYESAGAVRDLIHEFKYNNQLHLKLVLGSLLADAMPEPRLLARSDWVIVPVPLHTVRFRERGFNQSLELAQQLQEATGFPLRNGLKRTRYTTGQAHLDREGRLENLRGAIGLSRRAIKDQCFQGKAILLIDDVLTTGATAHECAEVLKSKGGAVAVAALCVARG
jgi:competence protein ComFC